MLNQIFRKLGIIWPEQKSMYFCFKSVLCQDILHCFVLIFRYGYIIYSLNREQSCSNLNCQLNQLVTSLLNIHFPSHGSRICNVHEMDKGCTCGNDGDDTIFKSHMKYHFSCHSNILEFDTKQWLPREKTTLLEQQICGSRSSWKGFRARFICSLIE